MRSTLLAALLITALVLPPGAHAAPPTYAQAIEATRGVAEPYFEDYIARQWDRLAPLLAEQGGFEDPTAALVFGPVKQQGKAATLKNFREGYAAIRHMAFHPSRVFYAGEHAVFEGTLDWTLALAGGQ